MSSKSRTSTKIAYPLLPRATAVWLIQNTALTFVQIADFCGLHSLEVKGIADGDVAKGIVGYNPIIMKQLTAEEIKKGEDNPAYKIRLASDMEKTIIREVKKRSKKYTTLKQRRGKNSGIMWVVAKYPLVSDTAVARLLSSTKSTVSELRNKTHWDVANITPKDPVLLGLCSQNELNIVCEEAAAKAAIAEEKKNDTKEK